MYTGEVGDLLCDKHVLCSSHNHDNLKISNINNLSLDDFKHALNQCM